MNIRTYSPPSLNTTEAMEMQSRLANCMTRMMESYKPLTRGDLRVVSGKNKPEMTRRVERVIVELFGVKDCTPARGAGNGAIHLGLYTIASPGNRILVRWALVYPTTAVSMRLLGLVLVEADHNDLSNVRGTLAVHPDARGALIQYTGQLPDDSYETERVAAATREATRIPTVTDDNHAVMKVKYTGAQCGVDLSCSSSFKLLGPESIGMIVGKREPISCPMEENYLGGMQAQGYEALDVLRGLTYAPMALAVSTGVGEECVRHLQNGGVPRVRYALLASTQSKVILVELEQEIVAKVPEEAEKLGAAPYPVGAKLKYEPAPMFRRMSGAFWATGTALECRVTHINLMRGGVDTAIRVLEELVERVTTRFQNRQ